jgi:hypothetical protein
MKLHSFNVKKGVFLTCGVLGRLTPSVFNMLLASVLTSKAFAYYQQQLYIAVLLSPLLYIGSTERMLQDSQKFSMRSILFYALPIVLLTAAIACLVAIVVILPFSFKFSIIISGLFLTLMTSFSTCILELTRSYSIISRSFRGLVTTTAISGLAWAVLIVIISYNSRFTHPFLPYTIVAAVSFVSLLTINNKLSTSQLAIKGISAHADKFLRQVLSTRSQYAAAIPIVLLAMMGSLLPLLLNSLYIISNNTIFSVYLTYSLVAISGILTLVTVFTHANWVKIYPAGSLPSQIPIRIMNYMFITTKNFTYFSFAILIILSVTLLLNIPTVMWNVCLFLVMTISISIIQSLGGIYRTAFMTSEKYIECGIATILSTGGGFLSALFFINIEASNPFYSIVIPLLVEQALALIIFHLSACNIFNRQ